MINYGFIIAAFIIVITVLNSQKGMSNYEIDWLIFHNFSSTNSLDFFIYLVSAIECWRCSSDAANADYCNDPSEANASQTKHGYVECEKSSDESIRRVVCKKVKKLSTLARNL